MTISNQALAGLLCLSLGCSGASAQQPSVAAQSIVEIVPVGTAGGPPIQVDRSEPATLIRVNDQFYLFDCGIGTVRRLARAGIPTTKIKALFFTHQHPDHNMDLAALLSDRLFGLGLGRPAVPLEVYGPPGTQRLVDAAAHFVDAAFETFAAEGWGKNVERPIYTAREFGSGIIYEDANIKVYSAENSHYSLMKDDDQRKFKAYSFKVVSPNGQVLLTGDTGPDSSLSEFGKNVDLIVSEVLNPGAMRVLLDHMLHGTPAEHDLPGLLDHMTREHLDPAEVGKMATKANAGSVLLTHFGPENVSGGTDVLREAVKSHYSGEFFLAQDLQVYCLIGGQGASRAHVTLCRSSYAK
ncbi:MBL fold metallo-hydrolase [Bradyrhizobium jicamae]|uniref:MBL fold metallo-hydrolase n=1 Tax=Bradyrhizobium jicamae TaxID=280332 RepID=UPI001BA552B6|nr:MBL fold metallo-hydrolase [Bradyrhizobium jicamae]MBR0755306.1 MBL fold metallo-hydrolase [Bradyrhizobium jicamae]